MPSKSIDHTFTPHLRQRDIRGSDVMEVAPAYDYADITAIAGAPVAMYMLALR